MWRNGTRESAEDGWVDQIENLLEIGEKAATSIDLKHFGAFSSRIAGNVGAREIDRSPGAIAYRVNRGRQNSAGV